MSQPILYSFRRCPYAMRARLAILAAGYPVSLREILLKDKPAHMVAMSPKATVPVLILPDGRVVDESLDVMKHALSIRDPFSLLSIGDQQAAVEAEIALCDGPFKQALDHTKYSVRHPELDASVERQKAHAYLSGWNDRLAGRRFLFDNIADPEMPTLADLAILPFVRQFAGTDRAVFDAQPWPSLHSWLNRFLESDIFSRVMQKYAPWQPSDELVRFGGEAVSPRF